MRITLKLQDTCVPMRLRAGVQLTCMNGSLWLTHDAEKAGWSNPDTIVSIGQRHTIDRAATYFLSSLQKDVVTICELDLTHEQVSWLVDVSRFVYRLWIGSCVQIPRATVSRGDVDGGWHIRAEFLMPFDKCSAAQGSRLPRCFL